MSIVVMGMDMSTSCRECIERRLGFRAYFGCIKGTVAPSSEERLPDCPLRTLPKRHGRLIEAERLRAEFPYPSEGMGGWRNPDEALVHKTGVWAAIDCAETIVEAEGE